MYSIITGVLPTLFYLTGRKLNLAFLHSTVRVTALTAALSTTQGSTSSNS